MKKLFFVYAITISFIISIPSYADQVPKSIQSIVEFFPVLKQKAGTIWPGFTIDEKPLMLIHADNDSIYLLHGTPNTKDWKKLMVKNTPIYNLDHDNMGVNKFEFSLREPFFSWENQQINVISLINLNDPFFNKQGMVQFYYFIYKIFASPYKKENIDLFKQLFVVHDGFNQAKNLSLLLLQKEILKNYLKTRREETLKDYAALFQYRYKLLDENSKIYEVKSMEPFAVNYVSLKAATVNDADFISRLLKNDFKKLNHFPLSEIYDDTLEFNHTALAFALDKIKPDWKKTVEETNTPISVLLTSHYALNNKEVRSRVEKAKKVYGYTKILNQVDQSLRPYLKKMKALTAGYEKNKGVELVIQFPSDSQTSSTGIDREEYALDSVTTVTKFLNKLEVGNSLFKMQAKNIPTYFYSDNIENFFVKGKGNDEIKLKLANETILIIDDEKDTVKHFVETASDKLFSTLTIRGSGKNALTMNFKVKNTERYRLVAKEAKLKIIPVKSEVREE